MADKGLRVPAKKALGQAWWQGDRSVAPTIRVKFLAFSAKASNFRVFCGFLPFAFFATSREKMVGPAGQGHAKARTRRLIGVAGEESPFYFSLRQQFHRQVITQVRRAL